MSGPSWLVDSRRIATKIKSASEGCDPKRVEWKSDPTRACPNCNFIIDNSDVSQEWPGLPRGVKFDPSDQEIMWHLLSKVGNGNMKPHPFIDEFIPTVHEDDGICYTHPQNLPGVKQDGSVSHFFHKAIKAYNTGTRKRRKIHGDDQCDVRWHKTGRTKPVSLDGIQKGCKKIMVLYMSLAKGGKAEKTNWVMHQYHIGTGEEENDGEYVVSKVFYQQQAKTGEKFEQELLSEITEAIVTVVDPVTPKPMIPDPPRTGNHHYDVDPDPPRTGNHQYDVDPDPPRTGNHHSDVDPVQELVTSLVEPSSQDSEIRNFDDEMLAEWDMFNGCGDETGEYHGNHAEDVLDSQIILDSQQLVEGLSLCDELFQSQSSTGEGDGDGDGDGDADADADKHGNVRKIKPCLSDYSRMGTEDFKRDLEECQKMGSLDLPNNGKTLKPCESDYAQMGVEDVKQDLEDSQNLVPFDHLNIELDTPPDFRLSQLEFGSQDSFLAWAGNPAV